MSLWNLWLQEWQNSVFTPPQPDFELSVAPSAFKNFLCTPPNGHHVSLFNSKSYFSRESQKTKAVIKQPSSQMVQKSPTTNRKVKPEVYRSKRNVPGAGVLENPKSKFGFLLHLTEVKGNRCWSGKLGKRPEVNDSSSCWKCPSFLFIQGQLTETGSYPTNVSLSLPGCHFVTELYNIFISAMSVTCFCLSP